MAAIDDLERDVRELGTRVELLSDVIEEARAETRDSVRSLRWWIISAAAGQVIVVLALATVALGAR